MSVIIELLLVLAFSQLALDCFRVDRFRLQKSVGSRK